jgi:cytochrome b561
MPMDTLSTPAAPTSRRYHPGLVVLHWVIAVLIILTALLAGDEGERGGQAATGLSTLAIHMILGITVLVLLLIRLVVRWRTPHPGWATAGNAFLDLVGKWTHVGLYFFAFAVTITGLVLALQTNRLARVFSASPPPAQFSPGSLPREQFPPEGGFRPGGGEGSGGLLGRFTRGGRFFLGAFHGASWALLLILLIVHVGAALYHQILLRDNLFGRMWFGSRS